MGTEIDPMLVADLHEELADVRENRDELLKHCLDAQACFGDIVRGKDHDGGHLMNRIDFTLMQAWAKQARTVLEATDRLRGDHEVPRPISFLDDRTAKVLESALEAMKQAVPFTHLPEHWSEKAALQKAMVLTEQLLKESGHA